MLFETVIIRPDIARSIDNRPPYIWHVTAPLPRQCPVNQFNGSEFDAIILGSNVNEPETPAPSTSPRKLTLGIQTVSTPQSYSILDFDEIILGPTANDPKARVSQLAPILPTRLISASRMVPTARTSGAPDFDEIILGPNEIGPKTPMPRVPPTPPRKPNPETQGVPTHPRFNISDFDEIIFGPNVIGPESSMSRARPTVPRRSNLPVVHTPPRFNIMDSKITSYLNTNDPEVPVLQVPKQTLKIQIVLTPQKFNAPDFDAIILGANVNESNAAVP